MILNQVFILIYFLMRTLNLLNQIQGQIKVGQKVVKD